MRVLHRRLREQRGRALASVRAGDSCDDSLYAEIFDYDNGYCSQVGEGKESRFRRRRRRLGFKASEVEGVEGCVSRVRRNAKFRCWGERNGVEVPWVTRLAWSWELRCIPSRGRGRVNCCLTIAIRASMGHRSSSLEMSSRSFQLIAILPSH